MCDQQDSDMQCIEIVKHGKKVLCGADDGCVNLFSWNQFGDLSDRLIGHPGSVDTMVKLDENTICTGGSDCVVRVVSVLPNKILGAIHPPSDSLIGIESIRVDSQADMLVVCRMDGLLHFYPVGAARDVVAQKRKKDFKQESSDSSPAGSDDDECTDREEATSASDDEADENDDDGAGGAPSENIFDDL
eukprot:GHVT01015731.1.p1 GENE.GHVT01015731.1~~GHVT01015731.1.p1  ORF type:complete len:189 (+),score=28.30 GHVT01015731.1:1657-2223(+)